MFTIEHEFDATVITLVDEGQEPTKEDVIVSAYEDCVTIRQYDRQSKQMVTVTLSLSQLGDVEAALDLPEGIYQRARR